MTIRKLDQRTLSNFRMGMESPERESMQAPGRQADAKFKNRRQCTKAGVVRGRRQVRFQEIHPEQTAGE